MIKLNNLYRLLLFILCFFLSLYMFQKEECGEDGVGDSFISLHLKADFAGVLASREKIQVYLAHLKAAAALT